MTTTPAGSDDPPAPPSGPKMVTVRMTPELHKRVRMTAARKGTDVSEMLRKALDKWADPLTEETT